jgi:(p)ppGpp synthase/HD superfamily hydrolase
MYLKALKIAYKAHKNQCRKDSNVPYIVHPIRVSGYFNDDLKKTIAILHDVVEDTDTTLEDLDKLFPKNVVVVIGLLSRKKEEKYFDYIKKISLHETAAEIKIADIIDNLSDTISIISPSMLERYVKSLDILIN